MFSSTPRVQGPRVPSPSPCPLPRGSRAPRCSGRAGLSAGCCQCRDRPLHRCKRCSGTAALYLQSATFSEFFHRWVDVLAHGQGSGSAYAPRTPPVFRPKARRRGRALCTNGHALRPRRDHGIAENSAQDKPRHKCEVIRSQSIHHRRRADGVRAAAMPAPIIALCAD